MCYSVYFCAHIVSVSFWYALFSFRVLMWLYNYNQSKNITHWPIPMQTSHCKKPLKNLSNDSGVSLCLSFLISKQIWLLFSGLLSLLSTIQHKTHWGSADPRMVDIQRTETTFSSSSPEALKATDRQSDTARKGTANSVLFVALFTLKQRFAFMAALSFHCSLLKKGNEYLNIHERKLCQFEKTNQ